MMMSISESDITSIREQFSVTCVVGTVRFLGHLYPFKGPYPTDGCLLESPSVQKLDALPFSKACGTSRQIPLGKVLDLANLMRKRCYDACSHSTPVGSVGAETKCYVRDRRSQS